MATFDWSQSEFSKFFHIKRVTTESLFVDVWEKFIAPSLNETSGILNINKVYNHQSTPASQEQASTTPSTSTPISQHQASTLPEARSISRKRKAEDTTPHRVLPPSLRPIRVISTEEEHRAGQAADQVMDEAIEKAFVGE